MTTERIKEIQAETGYPDSVSIQQALLKVWNECEQEKVKNCNITELRETFINSKGETFYRFQLSDKIAWSRNPDQYFHIYRKYHNDENWYKMVRGTSPAGFPNISRVKYDKPEIEREYEICKK